MDACTASETFWTVVTTVIVYSAMIGTAFTLWAIKEGEAEKKRRNEQSAPQADY
jgi:hypothetical protein